MSKFSEALMAVGEFDLVLTSDTPRSILGAIDPFSTVAILPTRIDTARASWSSIMGAALFCGYVTGRPDVTTFTGPSIAALLGDADSTASSWTTSTSTATHALSYYVGLALSAPPKAASPITVGTVTDPATARSVTWTDITPRAALDLLVALWADIGVEWRCNPSGTLDAGTADALYGTATMRALASKLGAGRDAAVVGIDTPAIGVQADWDDYATVIRAAVQDGYSYVATGASVPYKTHTGSTLARVRQISYSTDTGTAAALAGAQLLKSGQRRSLRLDLDHYDLHDVSGTRLRVGHTIGVYDPELGIADPTNPVRWRGQLIAPELIRVAAWDRPIRPGYGVVLRRSTGVQQIIDLTPYIETVDGAGTVTVDWLPRVLPDSASRNPGAVVTNPVTTDPPATDPTPPIVYTDEPSSITGATSGTATPGYVWHQSNVSATGWIYEGYSVIFYPGASVGTAAGALKFLFTHAAPAAATYVGSGTAYWGADWAESVSFGLYAVTGDLTHLRCWTGAGAPPADGSGAYWLTGAGPAPGVTWEATNIILSMNYQS